MNMTMPDDADRRLPRAYNLYSMFTRLEEALDIRYPASARGATEGYLELVTQPIFRSRDSTVWEGAMAVLSVARWLGDSTPKGAILAYIQASHGQDSAGLGRLEPRGANAPWRQLMRADSVVMKQRFHQGEQTRYPARFVLTRDGRLTGAERVEAEGKTLLTIRAIRVDRTKYRGEMVPR
jgi:hypothetical protein